MPFGGRQSAETPKLPAPVAQQETLTIAAQKVGKEERKRLLGRRGKAATQYSTPGFMAPVERRELKQRFG